MPRICFFWAYPSLTTTSLPTSWAVHDVSCLLQAELQMVSPSKRNVTAQITALAQATPISPRSLIKCFKFKICHKSQLDIIMSRALDLLRRRKRRKSTGYSPPLLITLTVSFVIIQKNTCSLFIASLIYSVHCSWALPSFHVAVGSGGRYKVQISCGWSRYFKAYNVFLSSKRWWRWVGDCFLFCSSPHLRLSTFSWHDEKQYSIGGCK